MTDLSPLDIRRAAMDLLARREHSFHELELKLFRKYSRPKSTNVSGLQEPLSKEPLSKEPFNKETLQALIYQQVSILAAENLQNDERFVESFVNGRKAQGKGPLRIRQELEQKRLPDHLITAMIDERDDKWVELAQQVYFKKFGDSAAKTWQEKSKRFRFMQYRGFSPSVLQPLVK